MNMNNTQIRPFAFSDAQAVVDLFNAYSQSVYGWDDSDLDSLMRDWTSPGINAEEDVRVVVNDGGEIIGYIDVWDNLNPHVIKYVWGILHPEAWNDHLYTEMLSWAEDYARQRIDLAPEGTRIVLSQGTSNRDQQRKKVLEAYGYQLVRHFYRMQIDLDKKPATPQVPEGLVIVPIDINKELEPALIAMEEAFEDHWGYVKIPIAEILEQWEHFLEESMDFDPSLWFLAKENGQIAGICQCKSEMVEDPDMGWVSQLCVRKPWRRRGLGMALLLTAFNEFYQRGKSCVGLGVDASSLTNATRLYEKAGMHVTIQYDTYEKEIRPGKILAKTS